MLNVKALLKRVLQKLIDHDQNWYMTSIFNKWLEEREIAKPEWFENNK